MEKRSNLEIVSNPKEYCTTVKIISSAASLMRKIKEELILMPNLLMKGMVMRNKIAAVEIVKYSI